WDEYQRVSQSANTYPINFSFQFEGVAGVAGRIKRESYHRAVGGARRASKVRRQSYGGDAAVGGFGGSAGGSCCSCGVGAA
ncbi:Protein CBG09546, partial [Caenorhabditis briggsae]